MGTIDQMVELLKPLMNHSWSVVAMQEGLELVADFELPFQ